jgi:hypothetical protein
LHAPAWQPGVVDTTGWSRLNRGDSSFDLLPSTFSGDTMKKFAIAKFVIGSALAAASLCSHAEDLRPLHFVLGTGITGGGEKLATVTYTNGDTQDIRSGGLVHYFAGVDVRAAPFLSVQATVGYHVDTSSGASNGSVRFTRVPVEVLGYFHVNDAIRLGGGVRLINSPELRGRGVASNVNESFDNSVGVVLEGEYKFTNWFGVKLRAVSESYRAKSTGIKANGDHAGVYAAFYL